MATFRLLLVDTCVILELFRLGLWETVLDRCDVHISRVILDEALYFEDEEGQSQQIDISAYSDRLKIHDVPASRLVELRNGLGRAFLERMDAGEAELLCILEQDTPAYYRICSADAIVFRYLGASYKSDQGLALEEILESLGLTRKLDWQFTTKFRKRCSQQGFSEGLTGRAFRP